MRQNVYAVVGYQKIDDIENYPFLYGIFSSFKKVQDVLDELEQKSNKNRNETFEIKCIEMDKPTSLYYVST